MKSDLDGFSDENDPDCFADESNGNSGDNPFDYSIDEIITQERIVSPGPAPKLLALMDKSSLYPIPNLDEIDTALLPTGLDNTILDPRRSEGAATPSKRTTTALKPIIEDPVSCSFQLLLSPHLAERLIGLKSQLGLNCTSMNVIVSEIAAEGISVLIEPQPLENQSLPWLSRIYTLDKATGDITRLSIDLWGVLSSL